jgi:predicted RNA-binding protein with PIN domain
MPYVIDAHNLLGRLGLPRESDDAKRDLVKRLAAFARNRKTSVVCIFDGDAPPSFARHMGSVTVEFSGRRQADELIQRKVAGGKGWKVVTADGALAARVAGRNVKVVAPQSLARELEEAGRGEGSVDAGDWADYFSDPKNRERF